MAARTRLAVLHAEQRQVVGDALRGGLARCPLADEDIRFVLEGALVVGLGAVDLGQQQRDVLQPWVGVRPAQEAVDRSRLRSW